MARHPCQFYATCPKKCNNGKPTPIIKSEIIFKPYCTYFDSLLTLEGHDLVERYYSANNHNNVVVVHKCQHFIGGRWVCCKRFTFKKFCVNTPVYPSLNVKRMESATVKDNSAILGDKVTSEVKT